MLLYTPKFTATDQLGRPLSGGKVFVYQANTTTPKTTYADPELSTPNAHPVVLDSNGQASVWLSGPYKVVVTDSRGVTQYTQDDLYGFGGGSGIDALAQDPGRLLAWSAITGKIENSDLNQRALQLPEPGVLGAVPALADRRGRIAYYNAIGKPEALPLDMFLPQMQGYEDWGFEPSEPDPAVDEDWNS